MIVLSLLVYAALRTPSSVAAPVADERELSEKAMLVSKLNLPHSQSLRWKYVGAVSDGEKVGETLHTITPNGICVIMDKIEISDCFTYSIHPQTPALSAKFTMR
uniref:DOMON domain-containing protein n=1 Tax=Angiostrongylus cantonensis TaxID=6313 RepID=A0A0K0D2J8_ANGCA